MDIQSQEPSSNVVPPDAVAQDSKPASGGDQGQTAVRFGRLRRMSSATRRFVDLDLWQRDTSGLSPFKAFLFRWSRILGLSIREFLLNRCPQHASALSYISILALVPALALAFSLMKGLGAYEYLVQTAINPGLDQVFGPITSSGGLGSADPTLLRTSVDRLLALAQQTDVFGLGVLGLILLLYTVIKLLSAIEETFNRIWGVRRQRSIARKLTDYLSLMLLGPLFLLVATALTAAAQNSSAVHFLGDRLGLGGAVALAFRLIPLVAVWIALTLLYLVMPNQRVSLVSAILGGIVAGTLWQVLQWLHVNFQIGVARFNAIYSGFAALPIFLAWIYMSWFAVLWGANLSFAHQTAWSGRLRFPRASHEMTFGWRVALSALLVIAEAFHKGGQPPSEATIARSLFITQRTVREALAALAAARLIAPAGEGKRETWLLARPPERIDISSIMEALAGPMTREAVVKQGSLDKRADAAMTRWFEALNDSKENLTLVEILSGIPKPV